MQQFVIGPNQAGQRFDKYLRKLLPNAQDSFLYKMLRKKNITLNGKSAKGPEMLAPGDEVKLFFSDETYEKFAGGEAKADIYREAYQKWKDIAVLYEDAHVLILNKPAGILSQKAEEKDLSLNEWLVGYLLQNHTITEGDLALFKPSICNRLDRNTSGLVLCGKSLAGSQALTKLIRERQVRKFYHTIVTGSLTEACRIEGYLSKDEKNNKVTITSGRQSAKQDYIQTAYRPLAYNENTTYLEVELITGKTHQIRAHLSGIGHPLIGDYKYGNKAINEKYKAKYGLSSQLLHAYRLEFPRLCGPLNGLSEKEVIAPLPELFDVIAGNEAMTVHNK